MPRSTWWASLRQPGWFVAGARWSSRALWTTSDHTSSVRRRLSYRSFPVGDQRQGTGGHGDGQAHRDDDVGVEGIHLGIGNPRLFADTPELFAESVLELFENPDLKAAISEERPRSPPAIHVGGKGTRIGSGSLEHRGLWQGAPGRRDIVARHETAAAVLVVPLRGSQYER